MRDAQDNSLDELQELIRSRIEKLRPKLLDLSKRNPLISARLSPRSNSIIRVVDELPDVLAFQLGNQQKMCLVPLPSLEDDPKDEQSRSFQDALSNARRTDEIYLAALDAVDAQSDESIEEGRRIERELRDRVRATLGMAARQNKTDLSLAQHAHNNGISASYELPSPDDAHEDGRHRDENIQTLLLREDLERKLNALMTKCRTWVQETGINVLHAALGFLEWSEPNSTESAFAPLVILPVEIEKTKTRDGAQFWVRAAGENAETNLVLSEKLRLEFAIEMPDFEGGSLEQYFADIAALAPPNMKWRVRRQIAVGVFPSARIAMYHDLDTSTHVFEKNEVVARLFGGSASAGISPYAEDYSVDEPEIESKVATLVLDADSSQFSTLVDIADGKNLAVEGPPGTGKSQTIVNAIAAAILEGKRVLFVAEKMAALEVVKSRLEAIGLGEFILPLQAERSTREQVIESVRSRLEMYPGIAPRDFNDHIERFRDARSELASYIELMSSGYAETGFTIHEVLGKSIGTSNLLEGMPLALRRPALAGVDSFTRSRIEKSCAVAQSAERALADAVSAKTFWRGVQLQSYDRFAIDYLLDLAERAAAALDSVTVARSALPSSCIAPESSPDKLAAIAEILGTTLSSELVAPTVALTRGNHAETMRAFLDACAAAQSKHASLSAVVVDPECPELSSRLSRLSDLCAACGVGSLDMADWSERLAALRASLAAARATVDALAPFTEVFVPAADLPVCTIGEVRALVQTTAREVMLRRTESNAAPAAAPVLSGLIAEGRRLAAERKQIDRDFSTDVQASPDALSNYAAVLRRGGMFASFSGAFREAKRFYRDHTKRSKPNNTQGADDFEKLAAWKRAKAKFESNPQAPAVFGIYSRGIETDFGGFDDLLRYYESINKRFPGPRNAELRKLLKTGDWDLLLSVADPLSCSSHSLKELGAQIDETSAQIARLEAALPEVRDILALLYDASAMPADRLPSLIRDVTLLSELKSALAQHHIARELLQPNFAGWRTNIEYLKSVIAAAALIASHPEVSTNVLAALEQNLANKAHDSIRNVIREEAAASSIIDELRARSGIDFPARTALLPREQASAELRAAAQDRDGLSAHAAVSIARAELRDHRLEWILCETENAGKQSASLPDLTEAVIARAMALSVFETHGNALAKHTGSKLDDRRSLLARLDREIIALSRRHVRAKVAAAANPPAGNGTGKKSTWTDMALINNEIAKKQKFIPVRELTKRAGRALLELKPCWMMSPLAVAQYLQAGTMAFDLCIIDEASQMPPEDAIGALARCAQAVIVGDTNQLPPMSFFRKMFDDEVDDEDEDGDLAVLDESILEMANGAFRPPRRLRWHYRSRHSGLIKFSNQLVYDNDLVIFPSPSESRPDMGVSVVHVQGMYRSGVNAAEALAIIEAALRFMRTQPHRSLGIVTLNQKQRDLLLEEMESALAQDAKAARYVEEWAGRNDGLESFFIKNLENVQGDERDVIFIGTVYGPERPGGPVMQRFGPINGLAGKRRLNVLFSRAREQIVTFSSMTAADIKADEMGNVGAYMLKRWLEYSATGILHSGSPQEREPDSDFEIFVMRQIKSMGCEPVPQVGVAGYFIDIAIKHPDWPHGYIMGVECDGATYHSARSARDRDRLREQVLRDLGWHLHRIWSTDWFNQPHKEADRLRAAISKRLEELKESSPVTESVAPRPVPAAPSPKTPSAAAVNGHDATPAAERAVRARATRESHSCIESGDKVRVRYLTGGDSVLEIRLSQTKNDPQQGVVHIEEPLGASLLGAEEGDEIEVLIGSYVRKALIEKVSKASAKSPMPGCSV